jgi:TP901 family phage tail tape measure protein
MADIETSIGINLDTSNALAAIKNLQREISAFHTSIAKGSAGASTAAASLQKDLIGNINATGQFSASMTKIRSTTESFTNSLEKNKFSMGEYFRYAGGASKTFGKTFTKEFDTIEKVARERVKDLQTQFISMGRDANGALQAIKIRPMVLDLKDAGTQMQIAAQKQQIFNQLLKQGSTNLLNFGKNTQWAGRQLMVGFTLPLTVFGQMAAKTFMDLEKQALRFRRVYGELFTSPEETDSMVKALQELSLEFTKYGVAVEKTMELAADAAAMGETGAGLLAQVTQANRLAVLGNVEQAKALETTISVTNAFAVATEDLAGKIDFLNAVENQTVTSIEDLTIAIPKAGPVVKQLGGDVEDLAFFLTAMKEGGINASEGANALKSGLAALINPTGKAAEMLAGFGINVNKIVQSNKGDVKGIVIDFAEALDVLDPLNRAQAIEQLFGKFQFSRLSTLFQNVIAEGTQAERVLALANSTTSELAALSSKELGNVADSTTFRFQKSIEELKLAIAPIGEQFLKAITPIIEFATKMLNSFNSMNEGVKNFVVVGGALLAGIGPVVLMAFGLLANGVANLIKGFAAVRGMFLKTKDSSSILGEQMEYMTQEQLEASSVAASLERVHQKLEQRFTSEAAAIETLVRAYEKGISAQRRFNPGVAAAAQATAARASEPLGLRRGTTSVPGPRGAGDIVPALLSPGEAVIPAKAAEKYAPIIQGMIAGNLPGFSQGVMLGMPKSGKATQKNREAAEQIYQMFLQSSYRDTPPTQYGHQLAPTSGHSFPIFGLGGVYMGPKGNKVFVKPVMDEKAALAEIRGTQIARQAHGLEAPEQRIVVIRDPQDVTKKRRFLALESDLDAKFVNNEPKALFNEEQYFRQLVASLVRADKDLAAGNMFGNVVADVGPAGVFSRASGIRDYTTDLPSMEQQALINLLGIKGGAKKAFAESTVGLMSRMTADQYHQYMISEIQRVLPQLKQTVAGFGLTNPQEADAYDAMIKRLEAGLAVDWRKFHGIHSAVKVSAPKQTSKPAPVVGYENGVISVPGPKGKGDVVPAMLSPGEAVIPAKKAKKYASLINAMISGNIPGYELGLEAKGGRPDSFKTYTEFTALLSEQQNRDLMAGLALPSDISGAFTANPEAIQGPLIAYLAEMLHGATTQVEIEKALNSDPSIEQYARGLSLNIAREVSQIAAEKMGDTDLVSAVEAAVASTPASAEIQGAVQQLSTRQTTYEEDTVERVRSSGRFQAMGRERMTADRGRYSTVANRGLSLANRRYGDVLTNPVAAHLTNPQEMSLSDFAATPNLSRQAQEAAARKTRQEKEIRVDGKSIVVPQDATPEQKRQAVEAGKSIVEDIGEELTNAAQTNSPSKKTRAATQGMVDGVVEGLEGGKAKVGEAAKKLVDGSVKPNTTPGSSFVKPTTDTLTQTESYKVRKVVSPVVAQGPEAINIARGAGENSMGPLKAYFTVVGANLREAVQEFKTEVGIVSSDSMGPLQAYLTTVKSNLREAWTESKAEFGAIFSGSDMSAAGKTASQKFREGLEAANPQIVIDGKEMGINFAAAAAGRQGGVEAVITKKNAELINAATTTWNAGIRELPKQGASAFSVSGNGIVQEITKSIATSAKALAPIAGNAISSNFFEAIPKANLDLGGDLPAGESSLLTDAPIKPSNLEKLNSATQQASFAFSSLASLTYMLGGDLGEFGGAITGISTALFALTTVTQLLMQMKLKEAIMAKVAATKNLAFGASDAAIFSGGIANSFKNLGKFMKSLLSTLPKIVKFFGLAGVAIGAFLFVTNLVNEARKKEKREIEGLGNVARMSAEKISRLAELTGAQEKTTPFEMALAGITVPSGLQEEQQQVVFDLATSEDFKDEFAEEIAAIETGSQQRVLASLRSLAINLSAKGFEWETIQNIVAALQSAAGRSDVILDFNSLKIDVENVNYEKEAESIALNFQAALESEEYTYKFTPQIDIESPKPDGDNLFENYFDAVGRSAIISGQSMTGDLEGQTTPQLNVEQQKAFNDTTAQTLNLVNSLSAAFSDASITSEDFQEKFKNIILGITGAIDDPTILDNFMDRLLTDNFKLDPAIAQLNDFETQTKLLGLAAMGVTPTVEQVGIILKGAAEGADPTQIKAMTDALDELFKLGDQKEEDNLERSTELNVDEIQNEITALEKTRNNYNELINTVDELTGEKISEAEAYELATDAKWATITAEAIEKGQIQELLRLRKLYNDELAKQPPDPEKDPATILQDEIDALEKDEQLKIDLEAAGVNAADAQDILNSSVLKGAAAAAIGTPKWKEFLEQLETYQKLVPSTSGGTPEKTPFEQAIEALQDQRKELINTTSAYTKLRKAGFSVAQAFKLAKDPITAAAVATTKVGTKKWRELLGLIRQVDKFAAASALKDLTRENMEELSLKKDLESISKFLEKSGYSAEQVQNVLSDMENDPANAKRLADDLKDGKVDAKTIQEYLKSIRFIKVELSIEDMESKVSDAFSKISEGFAAQRETIELDFELGTNVSGKNVKNDLTGQLFNTKEIQKAIKTAEEYIAQRQFEIDDNEYQLSLIQEQEDEINEKYDKRIEALSEINEINEELAQQQKAQLTLAGALTSGDMAAAAAAVQEMRAQEAERAAARQEKILEKARQNELDSVRSPVDGRSRVQIEERIKTLKDEILEKEEKILEPQQRALDLANGYKDAAFDSIEYLGKNESEWKKIESGVRNAKVEAEAYKKAIEDALLLIPKLQAAYAGAPGTSTGASATNPTDGNKPSEKEERIAQLNALIQANRDAVTKDKSITPEDKRLMAENIGLIKELRELTGDSKTTGGTKKLATGGFVSGPGTPTSDSIPAMLSNGEYVINAKTTKQIGLDTLDAINFGKVPKFARGGFVNTNSLAGVMAASKKPTVAELLAAAKKEDNKVVDKTIKAKATAPKNLSGMASSLPGNKNQNKGPFQDFEKGFNDAMSFVGNLPVVKQVSDFVGDLYSADNVLGQGFRGAIATLSTPGDIIGSLAKNWINAYGKAAKGDYLGAAVDSVSSPLRAIIDGTSNAFSGVLDVKNSKTPMFQQAAQAAIDNDLFGAKTNPEMAALARIIGGTLSVVGDPLTYLGIGLGTKLVKGTLPKPGFNSKVRTEQAAVAAATKAKFAEARDALIQNRELVSGSTVDDNLRRVAKRFVKTDARSVGPKLPLENIPGRVDLQSLTPQQILELVTNLENPVPSVQALTDLLGDTTIKRQTVLNPYVVTTGNQRTLISSGNPITDFLYQAGVIPAPKRVRDISSMLGNILGSNLRQIAIPQTGLIPKINAFKGPGGRSSAPELSLSNVNMKSGPFPYGPGTFNVSTGDIARTKNPKPGDDISVVPHELYHVQEGLAFRYDPKLLSPRHLEELEEKFLLASSPTRTMADASRLNAISEAMARRAESQYKDMYLTPYTPYVTPAQLLGTMFDPANFNKFVTDYLQGKRDYQLNEEWYKTYISTIKDYPIGRRLTHTPEVMAQLEQTASLLGKLKINDSSLGVDGLSRSGNLTRLANFIQDITDDELTSYGISPNSRSAMLNNLVNWSRQNGMKVDEYRTGGMVKPKYFNAGGIVKAYAKGGDVVPSMLTPGEFVMSKYAVQNYGVDKMKALNTGTYSGESVYNYEVNISVKSDANPDQIARAVMGQIKQIDSQRIRGNRF